MHADGGSDENTAESVCKRGWAGSRRGGGEGAALGGRSFQRLRAPHLKAVPSAGLGHHGDRVGVGTGGASRSVSSLAPKLTTS